LIADSKSIFIYLLKKFPDLAEGKIQLMSKKNPDCPMYTPDTCKEVENPKLCALVRKDKICLKKKPRSKSQKIENSFGVKLPVSMNAGGEQLRIRDYKG
jgi:hypothetical protein